MNCHRWRLHSGRRLRLHIPQTKMIKDLFDLLLILDETNDLHPPLIFGALGDRPHISFESASSNSFGILWMTLSVQGCKVSINPGFVSSVSPEKRYYIPVIPHQYNEGLLCLQKREYLAKRRPLKRIRKWLYLIFKP